jgi:PEP-CTERM motif-containing protein
MCRAAHLWEVKHLQITAGKGGPHRVEGPTNLSGSKGNHRETAKNHRRETHMSAKRVVLLVALVLALAPISALASLITMGSVPFTYSNGTGSGTVDFFGYTAPGNPNPPPAPSTSDFPEIFLGANSEWTYQVDQATGDLTFLKLHLGPAVASTVLYLENPDSPAFSFFFASACTVATPCLTPGWSVSMDAFGTIDWTSLGTGVAAGTSVGYFEYYSTLEGSSLFSLSVGDLGETDIQVGGPAAVPEPGSIFLLGSGLLGLASVMRRRFRGIKP